jgi:hypothetical protein
MKDIIRIERTLDKLEHDFNTQLSALGNNTNDFHNALIDLTAKYPEHKDLLQFIVHINDKLEMNHNIFSEVITDTFTEMLKLKKDLIIKLKEDKESSDGSAGPNGFLKKIISSANWLKDAKLMFASIAVIAITAGVIISPDTFLVILKAIAKIIP